MSRKSIHELRDSVHERIAALPDGAKLLSEIPSHDISTAMLDDSDRARALELRVVEELKTQYELDRDVHIVGGTEELWIPVVDQVDSEVLKKHLANFGFVFFNTSMCILSESREKTLRANRRSPGIVLQSEPHKQAPRIFNQLLNELGASSYGIWSMTNHLSIVFEATLVNAMAAATIIDELGDQMCKNPAITRESSYSTDVFVLEFFGDRVKPEYILDSDELSEMVVQVEAAKYQADEGNFSD